MSLSPGTRIGPYEVVATLGAGGMGEVYQARDTKLNRSVALKILPAAFASDPDRLARFKREAQVLAALNHPNIATIYGFEDQALVMELVPGQTLAAHITSPMPVADVLPIARQIASALEAAHEQGIVHRDLKPANIKVTDDGTVKVLDFGLAKAMAGDGARTSDPAASPAELQTITSPAMTELGMILGTAGYMAPEQARGKPVDRRADLWAMGVILFEMLAGKALYRGETVTDTIAHVITQAPDWNLLPPATPAGVRRLLRRCLEKDPRNRLQSAGDARIEIDELMTGAGAAGDSGSASGVSPSPIGEASSQFRSRSAALRWLPWGIAAALLTALAYTLWPKPVVLQPLVKLDVKVASGDELIVDADNDGQIAILSPDGQRLVYVGSSPTMRRLYVKSLDSLDSQPIPGTEGGAQPFFSPDGKSIGFVANGMLMRTQLSGGTPVPIVTASAMRGAVWGPDDSIVYTPELTSGLSRVSASGGSPALVTKVTGDERTHRWPSFLPGGQAVLFMCQMTNGSYDSGTIEAVRLDNGERKVLVRGGSFPRYVESGHLLYVKQGAVYAVPFDPARLEVHGEGRPVLTGIFSTGEAVGAGSGNGSAQIAVAPNGTAVYLPTSKQPQAQLRLVVVDRSGKVTYEYPEPRLFRDPTFSPDGRKIAVRVVADRTEHLHILDLDRGTLTQILFEGQYSGLAVWSKNGEQIAYAGDRRGKGLDVFLSRSDGTGEQKLLTPGPPGTRVPSSFSQDGRLLAFMEINPKTNMDIMVMSLADNTITPFINSPNVELVGNFSPDGKWMAYQVVDPSGRPEVFVRSYPDGGALRQVSNGGGGLPYWTKQGREIVYLADRTLMAVDVTPEGNALTLGKPRRLFELQFAQPVNAINYDAFPDGNRFAALVTTTAKAPAEPRTHLTMVFNLFDEIRRIAGKN
jgi:serine/threonine protein kinase/Tol biopolymer transport system component